MSDQPRPLGERLFTDGITRPIFELPDGRQYVEDAGDRVYGTWAAAGRRAASRGRGSWPLIEDNPGPRHWALAFLEEPAAAPVPKRGRPPKPPTDAEAEQPKRPRGRPRKKP